MNRLFREVHRRSLWQALGLYVALSWMVLQVVDVLADNMALPEWVFPVSLVLLLLGLPVVLGTAFVQGGFRGGAPVAGEPGGAEGAESPGSASAEEEPQGARDPRRPGGLLTWRNAALGGLVAFALLGGGVGAWAGMRTLGVGSAGTLVAKGLLENRARVVVADFAASADDASLARTVTEAFRIDFAESPVVRVADPAAVVEALKRMERDASTPLDADLARELARREGFPAVVTGEIGRAGSRVLLTAQVVAAGDGTVLASHRETADDDGLLDAIDGLSKRLRERIGESLGSLAGARPLARVTTSSLDALQKYTEAERAMTVEGNRGRGIALLEEAVALDSTFAMAYRKLGIALYIQAEQRDRQIEAFTRAFELRDRLSDLERYITEGTYYTYATGDLPKAVTAYENALAIEPDLGLALNNLALVYDELGDHERSWELLERNMAVDSTGANPYTNGLFTLANLGRRDEVRSLFETYARRFPDNPGVHWYGAIVFASMGEYEEADRQLATLEREASGSPQRQADANSLLALTAEARGRLAEGRERLVRWSEISEARGLPGERWEAEIGLALMDLYVRQDPAAAAARLDAAVERIPLERVTPYERPYWALATVHAAAGRLPDARRYLEALETEVWPLAQGDPEVRWQYRWARGAVAVASGDPEVAIAEYRAIDEGYCPECRSLALARGFDAAGRPDSARAHFERFAVQSVGARIFRDGHLLGSSLERLGALQEQAGEADRAVATYARFVELWAEADSELQPRVAAAQKRLEGLLRARG